ncbi:hypothetical protein H0H81_006818 [Sphagnurus paluster]|uniref:Uncharacterized protein n=1 Tax=Sphagnurus paluster TaxID=117069 RepID=A0A9P7K6G6_9AGAR|nr:hypothetical protein H0H81_006818 [Sphagnurus paluster]
MPESTSNDLQQVSTLFKHCITHVRSRNRDNLNKAAEEWITTARCDLMKSIEESYYELSRAMDNPLETPHWATDPNYPLENFTPHHSHLLDIYSEEFCEAFRVLLFECGFEDVTSREISSGESTFYSICIKFPGVIGFTRGVEVGPIREGKLKALPPFNVTAVVRIEQSPTDMEDVKMDEEKEKVEIGNS